jgi:MFS transporter, DHA1 family, multidrug resistance protein
MTFRAGTMAMTATLAMLTALGPVATDMYLPSLPAIVREFDVTASDVQLTLSVYLLGWALGQVVYGPLADRIGRRPVVLSGLALYIAAGIACAVAPTIEWLIGARFLQAIGGAGPIVLARAIVRDLYEGPAAGRELSRMGTIMGLVPALAPLLGGALEIAFGWRSSFWTVVLGATVVAIVFHLNMPETLRQRDPTPFSLAGILRGYGDHLRNGGFRTSALLAGLTYGGLFAFISGSSFVLQGHYRLTPLPYALSFGFGVLGFITGTLIAQRLLPKRGLDGTIDVGCLCLAGGGAVMLVLSLLGTGSSLEITLPMAIYAIGVGLVLPQANARAMAPFPDRAGSASSLAGLMQMTGAAVFGIGLGHAIETSHLALPASIALIGALALLIFRTRPS